MARIFITNHPIAEPSYGRKVVVGQTLSLPWNCTGRHWRKFICRSGKYLDNGKLKRVEELYFWGEYEPGSCATIMQNVPPQAVHINLTVVRGWRTIPSNALNTDPYVFGNHFKHICCGIGNRKYEQGDVILFGKIQNDMKTMVLDTVFVVKEKVKIDHDLSTTQYYNSGIKPMENQGEHYETFFKGVNFDESNRYFCFVPCRLSSDIDYPRIDITQLDFDPKLSRDGIVAAHKEFTEARWNSLVGQLEKAGWKLGVHVDNL